MKKDPFGNLNDWGPVLEMFDDLAENGGLDACQSGLIRILRYKGNWRLREEVLKRVGEIQRPSDELLLQMLDILADDNIYYDARILAGNALTQLLQSRENGLDNDISDELQKVLEKLRSTPQPPFFDEALLRLSKEADLFSMLEN